MNWIEKRRTGRTSRMLEHARELSRQGRAVYVVADNWEHVFMLQRELGDGPHGIKVEVPEFLGNLDWASMTMCGAHPNCVVLVDHFAIERRFGALVEMLTRYDEKGGVS